MSDLSDARDRFEEERGGLNGYEAQGFEAGWKAASDALRSKLIDQLRSAADALTIRAEIAYAVKDWGLADSLGERANGYRRAAEFIEGSTD